MIDTVTKLSIVLPGDPPTTTQKNTVRFNRATGRTYHSKAFLQVRGELIEKLTPYVPEKPLDGYLALTIKAYWTPPKAHKHKHWKNTKPDGDNSIAVIADQLEKLGFVANDSRFCIEHIEKHYDAEHPRLEIEIKEIKVL